MIAGCCMCICACGILGGGITVLVFTCIFLDIDKDKGGSDPTCLAAGDAIWTYVIVRLILGWCSGLCNANQSEEGEGSGETKLVGFFCQFVITLTIVIYGAIVILSKDVCDQYKNTGLYQMYYVMFWIDVSVCCFLLLCFVVILISFLCGGPPPSEIQQNFRSSISRGSINLTGADAVDLSGETLASADAKKADDTPEAATAEVIILAEGTPHPPINPDTPPAPPVPLK